MGRCCNGSFLQLEVEAMNKRLWSKMEIRREHIINALGFVIYKEQALEYEDKDFLSSSLRLKENLKDSQQYGQFVDFCRDIYSINDEKANNDEKARIEICILFEQVQINSCRTTTENARCAKNNKNEQATLQNKSNKKLTN